MEISLTPEQKAYVDMAIKTGRIQTEEDAVQEAMAMWAQREQARADLIATLDQAEASLARGEGRPIDEESMRALVDEVSQRGLARLAPRTNPTTH